MQKESNSTLTEMKGDKISTNKVCPRMKFKKTIAMKKKNPDVDTRIRHTFNL